MKLYELSDMYLNLLSQSEDFDEQLFNDTLESIDDAYLDKLESTAKVIQMIDGNISIIDNEIKRLSNKKKSMINSKARLKEYMQQEMEKTGKTKLKGELFNFNIQNNPVSVDIINEDIISKEYLVEQQPKIDKKMIIEDLKNGKVINGAELKQTKSLRIR